MIQDRPKPKYLYLDQQTFKRHSYQHSSGEHFTIAVRCVVMDQGQVRNPGSGHELEDLCLEAYYELTPDGVQKCYSQEAYYRDVFCIRKFTAMRMARTLKRIERSLANNSIKPQTFGQYVALVAQALKVRGIIVRRDETHASDYSDREHERFGREKIQSVVDEQVKLYLDTQARTLKEVRA